MHEKVGCCSVPPDISNLGLYGGRGGNIGKPKTLGTLGKPLSLGFIGNAGGHCQSRIFVRSFLCQYLVSDFVLQPVPLFLTSVLCIECPLFLVQATLLTLVFTALGPLQV